MGSAVVYPAGLVLSTVGRPCPAPRPCHSPLNGDFSSVGQHTTGQSGRVLVCRISLIPALCDVSDYTPGSVIGIPMRNGK